MDLSDSFQEYCYTCILDSNNMAHNKTPVLLQDSPENGFARTVSSHGTLIRWEKGRYDKQT